MLSQLPGHDPFTGRVKGLETLFNRCGWHMAGEGLSGHYALTSEKSELKER